MCVEGAGQWGELRGCWARRQAGLYMCVLPPFPIPILGTSLHICLWSFPCSPARSPLPSAGPSSPSRTRSTLLVRFRSVRIENSFAISHPISIIACNKLCSARYSWFGLVWACILHTDRVPPPLPPLCLFPPGIQWLCGHPWCGSGGLAGRLPPPPDHDQHQR